jgi:hypothetical protein
MTGILKPLEISRRLCSKDSPRLFALAAVYCGQLPGGVGPKVGFDKLLVAGQLALRL